MVNKEQKLSENQTKWVNILVKAWSDQGFKKKLIQDPNKTLSENGIALTKGMKYVIHENSDHVTHLVLPVAPKETGTEEPLSSAASGTL